MSFELFISGRYIRARQKQTFIYLITLLSIAGVTVGVMALIIVISVMAGFESEMKNRILGVESHVVVMRFSEPFTEYRKVMREISGYEEVTSVTPFVFTQAMLRSSTTVTGTVIRGIDPESAGSVVSVIQKAKPEEVNMLSGDRSEGGVPGILLGKELFDKLGIMKGDLVYLISPRGIVSPMGHLPVMKRFRVAGVFQTGMYEYDASLAYIHIDEARKILRMGKAVTGIEVRVKDVFKARKVTDRIKKELGYPYWARDWMQMNRNLFSALKLEKTVMFIILSLIVLVAAFNIASSLIMMVMEKTKDIAILKAMGARDRSIRKIFVYKGLAIGAIGTSLGVVFGCITCELLDKYQFINLDPGVYIITKLPVLLSVSDVVIIAAASMVICFLSTLYPAHQAAKLNPVEAFRYV